jgi:hypothetical protein
MKTDEKRKKIGRIISELDSTDSQTYDCLSEAYFDLAVDLKGKEAEDIREKALAAFNEAVAIKNKTIVFQKPKEINRENQHDIPYEQESDNNKIPSSVIKKTVDLGGTNQGGMDINTGSELLEEDNDLQESKSQELQISKRWYSGLKVTDSMLWNEAQKMRAHQKSYDAIYQELFVNKNWCNGLKEKNQALWQEALKMNKNGKSYSAIVQKLKSSKHYDDLKEKDQTPLKEPQEMNDEEECFSKKDEELVTHFNPKTLIRDEVLNILFEVNQLLQLRKSTNVSDLEDKQLWEIYNRINALQKKGANTLYLKHKSNEITDPIMGFLKEIEGVNKTNSKKEMYSDNQITQAYNYINKCRKIFQFISFNFPEKIKSDNLLNLENKSDLIIFMLEGNSSNSIRDSQKKLSDDDDVVELNKFVKEYATLLNILLSKKAKSLSGKEVALKMVHFQNPANRIDMALPDAAGVCTILEKKAGFTLERFSSTQKKMNKVTLIKNGEIRKDKFQLYLNQMIDDYLSADPLSSNELTSNAAQVKIPDNMNTTNKFIGRKRDREKELDLSELGNLNKSSNKKTIGQGNIQDYLQSLSINNDNKNSRIRQKQQVFIAKIVDQYLINNSKIKKGLKTKRPSLNDTNTGIYNSFLSLKNVQSSFLSDDQVFLSLAYFLRDRNDVLVIGPRSGKVLNIVGNPEVVLQDAITIIKNADLASKKYITFPYRDGTHFTSVVIDIQKGVIIFSNSLRYNSMGERTTREDVGVDIISTNSQLPVLRAILKNKFSDDKSFHIFNAKCPEQQDDYMCSVHTVVNSLRFCNEKLAIFDGEIAVNQRHEELNDPTESPTLLVDLIESDQIDSDNFFKDQLQIKLITAARIWSDYGDIY